MPTLAELVVLMRGDDKQLVSDLDAAEGKTESAVGNMASMFSGALVAGIAVAGAAIVGIGTAAFNVASDIDAATDQIGASLGVNAQDAKKFGDVIKQVYGNNFGGSIKDVGTAVEQVAKTLKLTATDPSLRTMTENAFRLRDVFGVEVTESLDAVKTVMDNFGVSSEEAFKLVTYGFQNGLDRSGDFLDTIGEYSTQFKEGGASAYEFFGFLESGLQGGMLGTDKAADTFKEFRVRIQDGSDTTKNALNAIGLSADEMYAKMADGSLKADEAFGIVRNALGKIDDKNLQMQAGVALLGTQFEDMGMQMVSGLHMWEVDFEKLDTSLDTMDTKYTSLGSVVEGMWRKFQVGIAPAGEAMLGFVNENLPLIEGLVNSVSGAVVNLIGLIPLAIAGARKAWDEDWAGIRTTWDTFAAEMPDKQAEFWKEWNQAFNAGSEENKDDWEEFLAGLFGGIGRWVSTVFDLLITFLKNWNNTTTAWHALTIGDWSTFWASLGANFTNAFEVLLSAVDIFDKGFGDRLKGSFQDALNGIKSLWDDFASWWNGTFGALFGMSADTTPTPNFAIVNPMNQPNALSNLSTTVPFYNPQAQTQGVNSFSIGSVNVNVNPDLDPYEAGVQTGRGIDDELRRQGR